MIEIKNDGGNHVEMYKVAKELSEKLESNGDSDKIDYIWIKENTDHIRIITADVELISNFLNIPEGFDVKYVQTFKDGHSFIGVVPSITPFESERDMRGGIGKVERIVELDDNCERCGYDRGKAHEHTEVSGIVVECHNCSYKVEDTTK